MSQPHTLSRRAEYRLVAGFAVLPLGTAGLTYVSYLALGEGGRRVLAGGTTVWHPMDAASSLALAVGIIGVIVTGIAVPAVLWLGGRGPLSLARLVVLGAVLGNLPFAVIVLGIVGVHAADGTLSWENAQFWYGAAGAVRLVLIGIYYGVTMATIFWLVGVRDTGSERDGRP